MRCVFEPGVSQNQRFPWIRVCPWIRDVSEEICYWVQGDVQLRVSFFESVLPLKKFHWIRGVIEPWVPVSQGCLWVRAVSGSKVSMRKKCLWVEGVFGTGLFVSLVVSKKIMSVILVSESEMPLTQWFHWARGIIEPGALLSWPPKTTILWVLALRCISL